VIGRHETEGQAMRSLPKTAHEHHDRIAPHVDRLAELAGMIGRVSPEEFASSFELECGFIVGQLVPHMAAIETTLYGQLEQLMGKRHSMTPMRREHDQLRGLFQGLCEYRREAAGGTLDQAGEIGLRRVLYRLYSILKVHLAEEELYLGVIDHNLSAEEKDILARGIDHAAAEPL
jgi:hypothetical protein